MWNSNQRSEYFVRRKIPKQPNWTNWQLIKGSPLIRFLIIVWLISLAGVVAVMFGGCATIMSAPTGTNNVRTENYIKKFYKESEIRRKKGNINY